MHIFKDRVSAGKELAQKLKRYKNKNAVVVAIPRGGVVTGFEVARQLDLPLEVIISRKIGLAENKEFGIGAVSENGVKIFDEDVLRRFDISKDEIDEAVLEEMEELKRRVSIYRNNQNLPSLVGKTVILVDDGLATGVTAQAAVLALKKLSPSKIIFAAPVCAGDSAAKLLPLTRNIVCVEKPDMLSSVGAWYEYFDQVSDYQVLLLLKGVNKENFYNQKLNKRIF